MTKPTDGAFMAACTMGRERPELQNSTAWGTDECMVAAHIIDREAVAPAVRELGRVLLKLDELTCACPDLDGATPLAEVHEAATLTAEILAEMQSLIRTTCEDYRHLIEESGQ